MRRLIKCISGVILVLQLVSCGENLKSTYATYAELVESGQLRNGWIPGIIPTDSKDIEEIHNIDSNKSFGQFSFEGEINMDSITEKVGIEKIISEINSINRPARPIRFPSDKELRSRMTINIRRGEFYILFDNEHKKVYFVN